MRVGKVHGWIHTAGENCYRMNPAFFNRQCCANEPQLSLDTVSRFEGGMIHYGKRKKEGLREDNGTILGAERQDVEMGSDSDSGNGSSDVLESPTREFAPLAFQTSGIRNSEVNTTYSVSGLPTENKIASSMKLVKDYEMRSMGHEVNVDNNRSLTYPVAINCRNAAGSEIPRQFPLSHLSSSPIKHVSPSRFCVPTALSKDDDDQAVEELEMISSEGDEGCCFSGEAVDPADLLLSTLTIPSPSDKNNNTYGCMFPGYSSVNWPYGNVAEAGIRSGDGLRQLRYTDSKDNHYNGIYDNRHGTNDMIRVSNDECQDIGIQCNEIRAKCEHFFGSRNSILGSRECNNRLGSHQNISSYGNSGVGGMEDAVRFQGVRDCDVSHIHHNESYRDSYSNLTHGATAVSTDYSLPSTPGDAFPRRYISRQMVNHLGNGQGDSPSKYNRYAKTSFNCSNGSDPQLFSIEYGMKTGSPRYANTSEYRRKRSISHEYAPAGTDFWNRSLENSSKVMSLHPALQQPFSDEVPATLPRPNKPNRLSGSSAAEQTNNSSQQTPVKGNKHGRPFRRWTNSGLSELETPSELNHTPSNAKPSPSSNRPGHWFNVPSILKAKKHSSSKSSGLESRLDSGTDIGSVGEVSFQSMSQESSAQTIFEPPVDKISREPATSHSDNNGKGFLRSASVPNPERCSQSDGMSFLEKLRTRLTLTPRKREHFKKSVFAGNAGSRQNQTTEFELTERQLNTSNNSANSSSNIFKTTTSRNMLSRFHSFQEPECANETAYQTKFQTFQFTPKLSANKEESEGMTVVTAPITAVATAAAGTEGCDPSEASISSERYQRPTEPTGEIFNLIREVDELMILVRTTATSCSEPDERTITEEDFNGYKQTMIIVLKEFIDRCKRMVINTPASSAAGFFKDMAECRRSLDVLVDNYSAFIECTSLPADRAKVANMVNAVAMSFKDTVIAASGVAGRTAKHRAMGELRCCANHLVTDLTRFMKTVKDMTYNRLSRRF